MSSRRSRTRNKGPRQGRLAGQSGRRPSAGAAAAAAVEDDIDRRRRQTREAPQAGAPDRGIVVVLIEIEIELGPAVRQEARVAAGRAARARIDVRTGSHGRIGGACTAGRKGRGRGERRIGSEIDAAENEIGDAEAAALRRCRMGRDREAEVQCDGDGPMGPHQGFTDMKPDRSSLDDPRRPYSRTKHDIRLSPGSP